MLDVTVKWKYEVLTQTPKRHLRDGDLRGTVVFQTKGATLQHLKPKTLTLISIYVHGHDRQRKLSHILHLEALSNGKQRLIGA